MCLSGLTLCVPCISTSQQKPATTEIEAQEIRWYLSVCPCCDVPPQDHHHQCAAAGDQTNEKQPESASDHGPDENLLNLKACLDVVTNETLSFSEKYDVLQKNLNELLRM